MPPKTVIHVVPHTHWDREWYEPFESYRFRLVKVVDRLLEVLDDDPGFRHFNFDGQTAAIEDYLEVRPPVGPEIERFVKEGRLALGPWRILMDEFLCSPETIIRNIKQGTERANAMGGTMRLGYIPDSFGHISQMPQLLRLAGLEDACVWRGVPFAVDRTIFEWESPDGSVVRTVYLATSYSNAASLPQTVEELVVRARRIAADLAPFRPGRVILAMNGTDHRGPEEHLPALFEAANNAQDEFEFRIASLTDYLEFAPSDELPRWHGEMRSGARANLLMGVASARMPLKQAEFAASVALERYAEPLSALARTDTGRLLERAWRQMVENSAHDSICGCGVDDVANQVLARYIEAQRLGDLVARDAADALAGRIDTRAIPEGAEGVVLLNPSPRPRAGVQEVTISVDDPAAVSFATSYGRRFASQLIGRPVDQVIVDMTLRGTELARIVPTIHSRMIGQLVVNRLEIDEGHITNVTLRLGPVAEGRFDVEASKRRVEALTVAKPRAKFRVRAVGPPLCRMLVEAPEAGGLGWNVLVPVPGRTEPADPVTATDRTMRNGQIEVRVDDDGTVALTHLKSGREFAGLFSFRDGGDAGDEYNYSPPERDVIVARPDRVDVERSADGPLEARLAVGLVMRVPAALADHGRSRSRRTVPLPLTMELAVRSGEPFVRARIELENRAKDHRLRVLFPTPFRAATSHAETAFAVAERGREAESGVHEHPLATYPCRRWVDASDAEGGLAVLHRGTPEFELTDEGIAVTLLRCVGWLSRSAMMYRRGPAGPNLETPGAQLLGEHTLSLAVFPHAGDWRDGAYDAAESFTLPFRAVVTRTHAGDLPPAGHGLDAGPDPVRLSALVGSGPRVDVRIYNASAVGCMGWIHPGPTLPSARAEVVDLHGSPIGVCAREGDRWTLPLRGWEIATIRLS